MDGEQRPARNREVSKGVGMRDEGRWFCRKTFHRDCNQYGRRRSGLKMSRQIAFPDHGRFQRQSLSERRDFIRGIFLREYAVSCRDLEEIMAERGVTVDHATLN